MSGFVQTLWLGMYTYKFNYLIFAYLYFTFHLWHIYIACLKVIVKLIMLLKSKPMLIMYDCNLKWINLMYLWRLTVDLKGTMGMKTQISLRENGAVAPLMETHNSKVNFFIFISAKVSEFSVRTKVICLIIYAGLHLDLEFLTSKKASWLNV